MGEPPLTTFTTGLGEDGEELVILPPDHFDRIWALASRIIMPGPLGAAVAALRAVQQDTALTPAYGAQVAVEGLELATLHIIRNESPAVVTAFAAKLSELIWTVRP
ncbi:hypothetical protein [Clavibacter michiganensis]|uniref:hypothetical protein n=1 Tax=Clavibacter michiganensis TaxID=28447 RepID=UPI003EBB37B2